MWSALRSHLRHSGQPPFSACKRALTPEGSYVLIGHEKFGDSGKPILGLIPHFFKLMFLSLFVKQLPKPNFSMPSKKDTMAVFREFLEAGKITPVIDRTYPLAEASEAIRYLIEGNPRGESSSPRKACAGVRPRCRRIS